MPPFIKDELKKKDEQRLSEMRREIDEADAAEEDANAASDAAAEIYGIDEAAAEVADEAAISAEGKLAAEVARLEGELKESDGSLKRLRADFENYRRRTAKEKEELSDFVVQGILKDMLPLVDNFERAMQTENTDAEAFKKGVEMIYNQFLETLKKNGLEAIDTNGATFDPNFHQAVMRAENPELPDGAIDKELQKGYMVKGRVIRPSMVQVVANQ